VIFDAKYHAASLAAVFMALGAGIVIGSLLGGDNLAKGIVKQQELIVRGLEQDYQSLKNDVRFYQEEMSRLKKAGDRYKTYALETLPLVIGGRLAGKKIAVIESAGTRIPDFLLDVLKMSGAEFWVEENGGGTGHGMLERLGNDTQADAVVYIDCRQFLTETAESSSVGDYYAHGAEVYRPGIGVAAGDAGHYYYLDSEGSITELAALILTIAGFPLDREAKRTAGP